MWKKGYDVDFDHENSSHYLSAIDVFHDRISSVFLHIVETAVFYFDDIWVQRVTCSDCIIKIKILVTGSKYLIEEKC